MLRTLKIQFYISDQLVQQEFIESGQILENVQLGEIDPTKLSEAQRAELLARRCLSHNGNIDLRTVNVPAPKRAKNDFQTFEKFISPTTDPLSALLAFLSIDVDGRLKQQEWDFVQSEAYKTKFVHPSKFLNTDLGNQVLAWYGEQNTLKLEQTPADEKLELNSRYDTGDLVYDFTVSEYWKEQREQHNANSKAIKAMAKAAKMEEVNRLWQQLEDWLKENGSDTLKMRIAEGFNWKAEGLIERTRHVLSQAGIPFDDLIDANVLEERTWEHGSPTLEQMETYQAVKSIAPDFMTVAIERGKLEEEEEELITFLSLSSQIGTTSIEMLLPM